MLEKTKLLAALTANIELLRTTLNNPLIEIKEVASTDHFYTDGGAIGAIFKISPFGFYYNYCGIPHIGCWGADWELYGTVCNEWVHYTIDTLTSQQDAS